MPRIRSRRIKKALRSPSAQLLTAAGVMVGGAALIGLWMVGIVLMVAGAGWGVDALLRNDNTDTSATRRTVQDAHEDVLERYRQAR
jgi:hypothetical protein